MQGLFADLYAAASRALRIGGRLVFVNPLRTEPTDPTLQREYQRTVDLGGFNCRLEMYRKIEAGKVAKRLTGKNHPAKSKSKSNTKAVGKAPAPAPAWWSQGGHANSREARRRARN